MVEWRKASATCSASETRRRVRMGTRGARGGGGVVGAREESDSTGAGVVEFDGDFVDWRGTVNVAPQPLQRAFLPANSSGTLNGLSQVGQLNSIISGASPRRGRPST